MNILRPMLVLALLSLLAACGNKGPLVRASQAPAEAAPATVEPAADAAPAEDAEPAIEPETEPQPESEPAPEPVPLDAGGG